MAAAPLIGILMIIGFRDQTTLFPRGEKSKCIRILLYYSVMSNMGTPTVLSFTAFLLSGTPSAINQLVATQIFAKEGQSLDTVSTFLLAQCESSYPTFQGDFYPDNPYHTSDSLLLFQSA